MADDEDRIFTRTHSELAAALAAFTAQAAALQLEVARGGYTADLVVKIEDFEHILTDLKIACDDADAPERYAGTAEDASIPDTIPKDWLT